MCPRKSTIVLMTYGSARYDFKYVVDEFSVLGEIYSTFLFRVCRS